MEKNLSERDREVIWHPYSPQKYAPDAIPIAKGEGVFLIGTDGRKYIDCISSWWVTIHGHGHPYIAEKIYRQALQLEQVIFAGFTHEPAVLLAERLLPILPENSLKSFIPTTVPPRLRWHSKWRCNSGGIRALLPERRSLLSAMHIMATHSER